MTSGQTRIKDNQSSKTSFSQFKARYNGLQLDETAFQLLRLMMDSEIIDQAMKYGTIIKWVYNTY